MAIKGKQVRVSVIMPCKNVEKYVEKAIYSIIHQTYRDTEILVVDDGSVDDTVPIARRLGRSDSRIRLITLEKSAGCVQAVNTGVAECRSEWVARMDADDISLPTRLERQLKYLDRYPEARLIGCLPYYIGEDDRILGKMSLDTFTPEECKARIMNGKLIFMPGGASLIHRETFLKHGGYRNEFEGIEDLELAMRFALAGEVVLNVPEYLYLYRKHASTNTTNMFVMNQKIRWIKERVACSLNGRSLPSLSEYLEMERHLPLRRRLRISREDNGAFWFKTFGLHVSGQHLLKGLPFLFLALACAPIYVMRKATPTLMEMIGYSRMKAPFKG